MVHYHVVAVCHDHTAHIVTICPTLDEALDYIQHFDTHQREAFVSITRGESTSNIVEFEAIDSTGEVHSVFATWASHKDMDIEVCGMSLAAEQMLKQLADVMHETFEQVQEESKHIDSPLNTDSLFVNIEDFLKDNSSGAN